MSTKTRKLKIWWMDATFDGLLSHEVDSLNHMATVLNLQIAKAYLAGTDNGMATRTWQNALDALIDTKLGNNQHRWKSYALSLATVYCCLQHPCFGAAYFQHLPTVRIRLSLFMGD